MNKCETYNIPCPYALSEIGRSASLPCFGTQEQCDSLTTTPERKAEIIERQKEVSEELRTLQQ